MPVEIPDTVKDRSFFRLQFGILKVRFDADIVVAGKYFQRNAIPESFEDCRQFNIFLTGKRRDTVFDVAKQNKHIRVCDIDDLQKTFKAISAPASEMQAMSREISLDPEMEIGNYHQPVFPFDNERRAIPEKFHLHNSLTNPFWGW
jgi:hypothetical protein